MLNHINTLNEDLSLMNSVALRRLPPLMKMNDGSLPQSLQDWEKHRAELIELLSREEYGFTPEAPGEVRAEILEEINPAIAGKAAQQKIRLSFDTPKGEFSFPFTLIVPKAQEQSPVFVNICFFRDIYNKYLPVEEIIDNGFALAVFCYKDVTDDSEIFDGIAEMYPRDEKTGWGKIGMWAFAASRIMDYLESRSDIDTSRACVSGHSRLGKTALWCAALDQRFSMAVSNNSGCSGAAISRNKVGESVDFIVHRFPFWFCGNYHSWACREAEMPFDQHMLLALIAPRKLYVCSALEDTWADPTSEFLACVAAGEAWELLGHKGLVVQADSKVFLESFRPESIAVQESLPEGVRVLADGELGYHLRVGTHYHSRRDWQLQMSFRKHWKV